MKYFLISLVIGALLVMPFLPLAFLVGDEKLLRDGAHWIHESYQLEFATLRGCRVEPCTFVHRLRQMSGRPWLGMLKR